MKLPRLAQAQDVQRHPLVTRLSHWLQALAIFVMIGSGWRIYNAAPIFGFEFPVWMTLGGNEQRSEVSHMDYGVANALNWHFTGMWLLALSYIVFMAYGIATGHFFRDFWPLQPKALWRDFIAAATLRLPHRLGEYNAVQRASYWGVLFAILMMVLTGASIWKPVQLHYLTSFFGGYPTARVLHFLFMSAIVLFIVVHVALTVIVPKTLRAMVLGYAAEPAPGHVPVPVPVPVPPVGE